MTDQRPKKRSLTLKGHRTSVSLEDPFWKAFCEIAKSRSQSISALAAEIDAARGMDSGLAGAIRLFVLNQTKQQATSPPSPTILRTASPENIQAILALYPLAFPDEDLQPLVRGLLQLPASQSLSLVAIHENTPVGHIFFSRCTTDNSAGTGLLLGPLAVAPSHQHQGLGSALIETGLSLAGHLSCQQIFVLGDPRYYHRFGFQTERSVQPPYPLPAEYGEGAWQSLCLPEQAPLPQGTLQLPDIWMDPRLW